MLYKKSYNHVTLFYHGEEVNEIGKMCKLKDFHIHKFQDDLLCWYEKNKRDLPWRLTKDPYHIWVSEIMLQQTRVDTVIPYFERFIEQFPTLEHLADADEESVLKAWEGLGYYSRARNLHSAVREVKQKYGGVVPDTEEEISKLKGVGSYTAGAILSIAYGKPVPAVDGNVMRVLSRILLIENDVTKVKTKQLFEEIAHKLIPKNAASSFNQALMELGALICTPKSPGCLLCPVMEHCRAFHEGVQTELPVKTKQKPPKEVDVAVAVLENDNGQFLIVKRPNQGLLANLWEFPNCESNGANKKAALQQFLESKWNVHLEIDQHVLTFSHTFSHIQWKIDVFYGKCSSVIEMNNDMKWVDIEEMKTYPFSVSHQKIIREIAKWN